MGLFDFFKPKDYTRTFVSQSIFNKNRSHQIEMTPKTLAQLRKYDVTADKELKLEFFFYTNTIEKAQGLTTELNDIGYDANYGKAVDNKNQFAIVGWTIKMLMSDDVVTKWVSQMCELGFKHDCEFDGWGTTPEQE